MSWRARKIWCVPARSASLNWEFHPPSSLTTRNEFSLPRASPHATSVASSLVLDFSKMELASKSKNTWSRLDAVTPSVPELLDASTTLELTHASGPTVDSCASSRTDTCQRATKAAQTVHKSFSKCLITFFPWYTLSACNKIKISITSNASSGFFFLRKKDQRKTHLKSKISKTFQRLPYVIRKSLRNQENRSLVPGTQT